MSLYSDVLANIIKYADMAVACRTDDRSYHACESAYYYPETQISGGFMLAIVWMVSTSHSFSTVACPQRPFGERGRRPSNYWRRPPPRPACAIRGYHSPKRFHPHSRILQRDCALSLAIDLSEDPIPLHNTRQRATKRPVHHHPPRQGRTAAPQRFLGGSYGALVCIQVPNNSTDEEVVEFCSRIDMLRGELHAIVGHVYRTNSCALFVLMPLDVATAMSFGTLAVATSRGIRTKSAHELVRYTCSTIAWSSAGSISILLHHSATSSSLESFGTCIQTSAP